MIPVLSLSELFAQIVIKSENIVFIGVYTCNVNSNNFFSARGWGN